MLFDTLDTREKAEQFRIDRLKKIETGKIWSPMSDGPYCVVHWLPISKEALLSVDNFNSLKFSNFIRMERGGYIKYPNADGVRFYSTEKDEIQEVSMLTQEGHKGRYFWNAQMFHSGALEMVFAFSYWTKPEEIKSIPRKLLTKNLWEVMSGFKGLMLHFNITAPIIVGVSLLRVMDYRFSPDERKEFITGIPEPRRPSDKEQIILRGTLIENLENTKEVESSIFDMLWRSFGYEKCEYHEENKTYPFYGASGNQYEYSLPQDINVIPSVAGNYMLAAWYDNKWQVLYLGESENLQNRLVNNRHEKMTDATVLAHPNSVRILYDANQWDEENRKNAKKNLIANYNPPLNIQSSTQSDKNTQQKTSKNTDKVIKTRLRTVQNATPLAESIEWNSNNQKIRIIPASVSNTELWKNVLERLNDEISDIKNNDRLSNTHAALIPVIEKLESKLEHYKNSPHRIHDEIDTMLSSVKWLEDKREIANDIHTQRLKKVLTDCALDIKGNVPKVQEAVEKRKKLSLTEISKGEQDSLTSITEKVIPYIEEEQVKQDMKQGVEAFKESPKTLVFQEKTFKIYRWISRLSRILDMLLKNSPSFLRAIGLTVINKIVEIIFKAFDL